MILSPYFPSNAHRFVKPYKTVGIMNFLCILFVETKPLPWSAFLPARGRKEKIGLLIRFALPKNGREEQSASSRRNYLPTKAWLQVGADQPVFDPRCGSSQELLSKTILSTPLPPVRWLIPDLLPAGLSLLAGASKAGKSWLCLWMCLQLANGGEIWNRTVPPQTVLYLCLEDTFARIQARLFRLTEDAVPERLFFQTGSETIGNGLEVQIEKFLAAHQETALVVIDTLQKVRSAEPMNGSYASDYQDMSALKALADRHRIGILLVHHLRKQGAADPFHQISSSNGLMGAAEPSGFSSASA